MTTLLRQHDCLLLDLDGTMFRGHLPTEGAVDALATSAARTFFVTNNASRSAAGVASHLGELGFSAAADDVVTSGQAAAHLLAEWLPVDTRVLVVGTNALAAELETVGLRPVRRFADDPAAVVQGHSPDTCWADLSEAALAIRSGVPWVATNADRTLPTERGLVPGNGSMVAALRTATDREPQLAGKPAPLMLERALAHGNFHSPLVVGDRLDTDISSANAAGIPGLLVLSGVSTASDLIDAPPSQRPAYLAHDLRSLHSDIAQCAIADHPAWRVDVDVDADVVTVAATDASAGADDLAIVRATARAVWDAGLSDGRITVQAGDRTAATALSQCCLTPA